MGIIDIVSTEEVDKETDDAYPSSPPFKPPSSIDPTSPQPQLSPTSSNASEDQEHKTKNGDIVSEVRRLRVNLSDLNGLSDEMLKHKELQLDEQTRKIETLNSKLDILKSACVVLEQQLKDFEALAHEKNQHLEKEVSAKTQLEVDFAAVKDELIKTRTELNEEKSLKLYTEKKLKEIQSNLKTENEKKQNEIDLLNKKISLLKMKIEDLTNDVTKASTKLEEAESSQKLHHCQLKKFETENLSLKLEISRHITDLVTLKESNVQLAEALNVAATEADALRIGVERLNEDKILLEMESSERDIQHEETISQQMKLIEYLQGQIDSLSKKKKFKLFGKDKSDKENSPGPQVPPPVLQFTQRSRLFASRNIEAELKEFSPVKADVAIKPEQDVSKQYHNLSTRVSLSTTKCWKCSDPIYFGHRENFCMSCPAEYHTSCATCIQNSCGLSFDFAIEMENKNASPGSTVTTEDDEEEDHIAGWIQVVKDNVWKSSFLRLHGGKLNFYESDLSTEPILVFPVTGDTKVELNINPQSSGNLAVQSLKSTESASILKIITPLCDAGDNHEDHIFLLTSSSRCRRFWARVIRNRTQRDTSFTDDDGFDTESNKSVPNSNINKTVIFREDTVERLHVNHVQHLSEDIYLLGCDSGLYSRNTVGGLVEGKVKIEGVGAIYQIEIQRSIGSAIMIEGNERQLIEVTLGLLRACATAAPCSKPKCKINVVDGLQNYLMFETQMTNCENILMAVLTPEYIHLLLWDEGRFQLTKNLSIPNSLTISCMKTTPTSIIFGCEKLYEVDIKNLKMKEFIDDEDHTLNYISSSNPNSDPIKILDVGMSNLNLMNPNAMAEFLLCFPDLGVFVNSERRRSRSEDIVWSKVPLDMVYCHPNLCVLHYTSVEIIKIGPESYTHSRLPGNKDEMGKDCFNVPKSHFIQLSAQRLFGIGKSALLVGSYEKSEDKIISITLDNTETNSYHTAAFDISGSTEEPMTSEGNVSGSTYADLSSGSDSV